jgi:hypothetical protein
VLNRKRADTDCASADIGAVADAVAAKLRGSSKKRGRVGSMCFNCGREGHFAGDCGEEYRPGRGLPNKRSFYYVLDQTWC